MVSTQKYLRPICKRAFLAFLGMALLMAVQACTDTGADLTDIEPQYDQTKQVITLVEKAAELLKQEGEKAIPEFRKKDSSWFHGETYVFVHDLKGNALCIPTMPELEGTNILNLTDVNGKRLVAMISEKGTGKKGAGWVHYKWPRPGDNEPTWKSSYVMRVKDNSGKEYMVGSGLYNMKVEKLFLVETVDEAAEQIKQNGKRAFPTLRDKAEPFWYQDVYVFVHDKNGIELVNPAFPELENTNILDSKDVDGKPLVRETIEMLETKETGWISYRWPKPGETEVSTKLAYVRKVKTGDDVLYIGAGLYLD